MLIFLDLETSGVTQDDEICSLSYIYDNQLHKSLFKPSKKLKADSMQIHNITNEMIKDKVIFRKSELYGALSLLNTSSNTLVVHNAAFISMMLSSSGLTWQGEIIDTERCAKHLMDDLDHYTLQFLRYELKLYKQESERAALFDQRIMAHNSSSDVIHIELLYHYLLELSSFEALCALSLQPIIYKQIPFGKHKNRYFDEIAELDLPYLQWLYQNMESSDEDLKSTLEFYIK